MLKVVLKIKKFQVFVIKLQNLTGEARNVLGVPPRPHQRAKNAVLGSECLSSLLSPYTGRFGGEGGGVPPSFIPPKKRVFQVRPVWFFFYWSENVFFSGGKVISDLLAPQ